MLLENLLKRPRKKSDCSKLKKIKVTNDQKELLRSNTQLMDKAFSAQKIYNKGVRYIFVSFFIIMAISLLNENDYAYKVGSLIMTAIALPMILSLSVISFERMNEVDNDTIYQTDNSNKELQQLISIQKENNKILNDILVNQKETLMYQKIEKQKIKSRRKYK